MNYRNKEEEKRGHKNSSLIKCGQLRARSVSPKEADLRAAHEEDIAVVMENFRHDTGRARKQKNYTMANETEAAA